MADNEAKIYGVNFSEPLWDEEFPGATVYTQVLESSRSRMYSPYRSLFRV